MRNRALPKFLRARDANADSLRPGHACPSPQRIASPYRRDDIRTELALTHQRQLFDAAEAAGFELLVTTDQHLRNQQNLAKRRIRILVLKTASWPAIEKHAEEVARAIDQMEERQYQELSFPSGG